MTSCVAWRVWRKKVEGGGPDKFKRGFEAQLQQAEKYFKEGKLKAVEFREGKNVYDWVLVTDEVVEVKYWTDKYANEHVGSLLEQIGRYASSRDIILELGRTKTNPIGDDFIDALLDAAKDREIPLTRDRIRFFDLE